MLKAAKFLVPPLVQMAAASKAKLVEGWFNHGNKH
jgi:hypothetical protein